MVAAPNMRFTFDSSRQLTTFDHLLVDHFHGAQMSYADHFQELVKGMKEDAALKYVAQLQRDKFSIHFHVWNENTFVDFIGRAIQELNLPLSLMFSFSANTEIITIIEKISSA
jgi:hypothetical protein